MGHYDKCYEADEKEKAEKENDEVDNEIRNAMYSLSLEEKKFLVAVIKNIDAIKAFSSFIKSMK
jgi:hypothetical protein